MYQRTPSDFGRISAENCPEQDIWPLTAVQDRTKTTPCGVDHKMTISIVVPVHNGAATIGPCLQHINNACDPACELLVVDDGSTDNTLEIVRANGCRYVSLPEKKGAGAARNVGALMSTGDCLFFTDADCVLSRDTLEKVREAMGRYPEKTIIGGTYHLHSFDNRFFSRFQAAFINYCETKKADSPDYITTHAMAMKRADFYSQRGFAEDFLPILEDVAFSHRLQKKGFRLLMVPEITVRHIFHHDLKKSLSNAFKKARYWTWYSLENGDLASDSGTAGLELKGNCLAFAACGVCLPVSLAVHSGWPFALVFFLMAGNIMLNRRLFRRFRTAGGWLFRLGAATYYLLVYPMPVLVGGISGLIEGMFHRIFGRPVCVRRTGRSARLTHRGQAAAGRLPTAAALPKGFRPEEIPCPRPSGKQLQTAQQSV